MNVYCVDMILDPKGFLVVVNHFDNCSRIFDLTRYTDGQSHTGNPRLISTQYCVGISNSDQLSLVLQDDRLVSNCTHLISCKLLIACVDRDTDNVYHDY